MMTLGGWARAQETMPVERTRSSLQQIDQGLAISREGRTSLRNLDLSFLLKQLQ